jgi:hypothetical protein
MMAAVDSIPLRLLDAVAGNAENQIHQRIRRVIMLLRSEPE